MTLRTILVATDLAPESPPIVDYAFEMAEKLGALVHVLHAYPIVVVPGADGAGFIPFQALHERALQRVREATRAHHASSSMGKCVVDLGPASTIINEMADELAVDLIIVGTHARKGVQRWVTGSVAEGVLRESKVPVLVLRVVPGHVAESGS